MIHLLGGLLLVLGGGALGLGYERRKRREQRCIRETLRALGELRAGVCRLRTPLPLLLSRMTEGRRVHAVLLTLSAVLLAIFTFGYTIAVDVL